MDRYDWLRARMPTRRRLIQLYAALLYNAQLKGFITGGIYTGALKNLCVPGLNCYSCPGAVAACPLGSLQNALATSGTRAPAYAVGVLLLFGLILGRTICGFLCPFGLIQELLYKLPTPKARKGRLTRALSYGKYVILIVFVVLLPLISALRRVPLPAFCKYICPAGTLEGAVGLLASPANADAFSMLGLLFVHKYVILIAVAAACVFIYRAFCRFICPLGAIYGLFARYALVGVRVDILRCNDCGQCVRRCKTDIRCVGDRECVQCGECISACPRRAIAWKGAPRVRIAYQERAGARWKRIAAWAAALSVLCAALWYFNLRAPEGETLSSVRQTAVSADTPVGPDAGMRCPAFTVPYYEPYRGAFDVEEARGRVVVINFWATWCAPCLQELPYFAQLLAAYPEDIAVVAIHSSLVTEDVPAFLTARPYALPFALDESGDVLTALGGSAMLPQTVIVDRNGLIVYNQAGSLTYPALAALVEPLL